MPRLGQHFLKNKSALKKIIDSLDLRADDFVIEIGPGHGELTTAIAAKTVRKIVAIEKDLNLAHPLHALFAKKDTGQQGVDIIEGDALTALPDLVRENLAAGTPWKLAGNIPYYITGKLLRVISDLENKPARSVIMVQSEVAVRMCAKPPDMNRLAASVQFWAVAKIVMHVPKEDFSPIPEVDSAVVLLEAKTAQEEVEPSRYYDAVRSIFAQPRKTILNNIYAGTQKKLSKQETEAELTKLSINPGSRPQDLTIRDISSLARMFF